MAIWTGAFSFAHIKYRINKCLETLLCGHGVTAEWEVFCHSGKEKERARDPERQFALQAVIPIYVLFILHKCV